MHQKPQHIKTNYSPVLFYPKIEFLPRLNHKKFLICQICGLFNDEEPHNLLNTMEFLNTKWENHICHQNTYRSSIMWAVQSKLNDK